MRFPSVFPRFGADIAAGVAFTSKMVTPKPAANNEFMFQKIFGDGDFIAAGQLIIPEGGKKPSKGTKDNSYVCIVDACVWAMC